MEVGKKKETFFPVWLVKRASSLVAHVSEPYCVVRPVPAEAFAETSYAYCEVEIAALPYRQVSISSQ
jgi:hypothetical protein